LFAVHGAVPGADPGAGDGDFAAEEFVDGEAVEVLEPVVEAAVGAEGGLGDVLLGFGGGVSGEDDVGFPG
jgi:hypothetical protein